jgi:hypothetical protein
LTPLPAEGACVQQFAKELRQLFFRGGHHFGTSSGFAASPQSGTNLAFKPSGSNAGFPQLLHANQ